MSEGDNGRPDPNWMLDLIKRQMSGMAFFAAAMSKLRKDAGPRDSLFKINGPANGDARCDCGRKADIVLLSERNTIRLCLWHAEMLATDIHEYMRQRDVLEKMLHGEPAAGDES